LELYRPSASLVSKGIATGVTRHFGAFDRTGVL
jgi:hypothetical protein